MNIIVECRHSAEASSWSGVVLLSLGQEEIDELWGYEKTVRELQLRHISFDALRMRSYACTYYEGEAADFLDARRLALFEENLHVYVPDDFQFPDDERVTRTESDRAYVSIDSVFWFANVKHTDYSIASVSLGWNMFTCWVHGTQEADRAWCLRCATL